ncbi:cell division protein FtsL [Thermanaeromonas toyohensis ToBE]|uniref:Cell division protein FtsL n=1 Tax=Thermanaeromonas toyohensis ToBE TaxID=698762 RepID=A0A1W1VMM8_9FIRM|nr:septum formation initiator family protein [Thermanaeromonas toyohensis]SMB94301.1 cell division protein FtsL [Thermanaeromonas toyohensis ToBE]
MLVAPQVKLSWPQQPLSQPYPRKRKAHGRRKIAAVGLIFLAFALGLTWTIQSVLLVLKGYELARIKKEIFTLQQANQRLELEVARLKSPERVAELATTKLGMIKPAPQDVQFSTALFKDNLRLAKKESVQPEQGKRVHSFWVRVGQALQHWLAVARPAQAADS